MPSANESHDREFFVDHHYFSALSNSTTTFIADQHTLQSNQMATTAQTTISDASTAVARMEREVRDALGKGTMKTFLQANQQELVSSHPYNETNTNSRSAKS